MAGLLIPGLNDLRDINFLKDFLRYFIISTTIFFSFNELCPLWSCLELEHVGFISNIKIEGISPWTSRFYKFQTDFYLSSYMKFRQRYILIFKHFVQNIFISPGTHKSRNRCRPPPAVVFLDLCLHFEWAMALVCSNLHDMLVDIFLPPLKIIFTYWRW